MATGPIVKDAVYFTFWGACALLGCSGGAVALYLLSAILTELRTLVALLKAVRP